MQTLVKNTTGIKTHQTKKLKLQVSLNPTMSQCLMAILMAKGVSV